MQSVSPIQTEPDTSRDKSSQNNGRQRARTACTRCRRLRKKCLNDKEKGPCFGCQEAGPAAISACRFPARGEPDFDRSFRRHPPKRNQEDRFRWPSPAELSGEESSSTRAQTRTSASTVSPVPPPITVSLAISDRWQLLPPYPEVVEACKVFGSSFFQLGFLPKALFLEQLANNRSSINVFFMLGILSISARFTPSLITRYGDGLKAAEVFMEYAAKLVPEEMYCPTLERIQAFFLLAIAEWGKGDKTLSNIHMGIAVRMAGILRLHREETYALTAASSAEDIINAEMARRTFWMLESQDNLHSGYTTPVSFSLGDITTLLPCEESDFSFGIPPSQRAALAGTLAAARYPNIVHTPSRSLFATLIQAHNLWGQVARGAVTSGERYDNQLESWNPESDYSRLRDSLTTWESKLPSRHKWSIWNFRGYKAEGLDLAYLSIVMVLRLSNIILRRSFIENILSQDHDLAPPSFWENMSNELFENVLTLHEQINAFSTLRPQEQGFPAMIIFCVYVCGSLANHLWKRPELCPSLANGMEEIVKKSLRILSDLQHPWQLARKWKISLEQRAFVPEAEHIPASNELLGPALGREYGSGSSQAASHTSHPTAQNTNANTGNHGSYAVDGMGWKETEVPAGAFDLSAYTDDDIESQLLAFLEVQGQLGMLYD